MTINLRDAQYFVVVAEHAHVGRAAEALGLSQPALSRSLRRLERSMDTPLFTRTPKGVQLTAVGAAFLAQVRRLRLLMSDIEQEVADLSRGSTGRLTVGANGHAVEHLLPGALEKLFDRAPNVSIKVTAGSNDMLVPALRCGEADLILTGLDPSLQNECSQIHCGTMSITSTPPQAILSRSGSASRLPTWRRKDGR